MRLPFLDEGYQHAAVRWLDDVLNHDIPTDPGAYVLLAGPGTSFVYPRRRSSVFYVGKAVNLRSRLQAHARFVRQARRDRRLTLYWPMYEYGASLGCRYTFIPSRRIEPRVLEQRILAMFAENYRAWPVANGVGGWTALLTPRQLANRRDV